jgi:hypothetical protein
MGPGGEGVAKNLAKKTRFYEIAMQSFPSLETLRLFLRCPGQKPQSLEKHETLRYPARAANSDRVIPARRLLSRR